MQYVSWDRKSEEEVEYCRSMIDKAIDEWIIGRNAERDRAIIRRKLFDGVSYEKLAEEFGLSVRQTKRIIRTCEIRVFKHIK